MQCGLTRPKPPCSRDGTREGYFAVIVNTSGRAEYGFARKNKESRQEQQAAGVNSNPGRRRPLPGAELVIVIGKT